MIKFEKVSRFADVDLPMPARSTKFSAGYDFVVAEDIVLKPYDFLTQTVRDYIMTGSPRMDYFGFQKPHSLDEIAEINKELKTKLPLVSTGFKCCMPKDMYLELSVRSSTPLKHWIMMANGVGIIDADYYNSDNEGEIFFQLINLAPFAIQLKRGDKIGQGIFHHYHIGFDDDEVTTERSGGLGSTTKKSRFVSSKEEVKKIGD